MDHRFEVAAIVGSLRRESLNQALLQAAVELAPSRLTIAEAPIRDVPLYDADVEREGDPPAVTALKERLLRADAVLIVTPEYNHSVPGVLKNALDWASRKHDHLDVLAGKPAAMMGASPGRFGTTRAQLHLRSILPYLGLALLPKPEVFLANARESFDDEGRLVDERARRQVETLLAAFADWIERIGGAERRDEGGGGQG